MKFNMLKDKQPKTTCEYCGVVLGKYNLDKVCGKCEAKREVEAKVEYFNMLTRK